MSVGVEAFTVDELLDVIRGSMSQHWWGPMEAEAPAGGWEVLTGQAEVMEALSLAVELLSVEGHVAFAKGPGRARVTVRFDRSGLDALTIKAGSLVATVWGLAFKTRYDVVWAAGDDSSKEMTCIALAPGYDWNVGADEITVMLDPPIGKLTDSSVTLTNPDPAESGVFPMLDLLVSNRGLSRSNAETDDQLRARFRTLPDLITPGAILRVIAKYFGGLEPADYIEGWEAAAYCGETGDLWNEWAAYTDAGDAAPHDGNFSLMVLSHEDCHRSFFVIVPNVPVELGFGTFATDDAAMAPELNALGETGDEAFNGFLDGEPLEEIGQFSSLASALDRVRGPGIRYRLIGRWTL